MDAVTQKKIEYFEYLFFLFFFLINNVFSSFNKYFSISFQEDGNAKLYFDRTWNHGTLKAKIFPFILINQFYLSNF